MKITVAKEKMSEVLQSVAGVVEKRHTAPILANLRLEVSQSGLVITATDNEVQLTMGLADISVEDTGTITASARKLLDLCRSLPGGVDLTLEKQDKRLLFTSGNFKSHLSTLPPEDFPLVEEEVELLSLKLPAKQLKKMLERTSFAMAQQDVRYFFNGMLFDLEGDELRLVATNGQRLATCVYDHPVSNDSKFIVPRKGVIELSRIISDKQEEVTIGFSQNHMSASCGSASMISKLIDGTFPDYQVAIPHSGDKVLEGDRSTIRDALVRTAILSNEMYRNVKLHLVEGCLGVMANNPLQEDAEEEIAIDYQGPELEIGFNVSYLIDSLSAMEGDKVRLTFTDGSSAVLIQNPEDQTTTYVISPMVI